jgi:hypothetical protein
MTNTAANFESVELSALIDAETIPKKSRKAKKTKINLKRSMTKLVEARWDATRADETAIRTRYRETLTLEEALAELAQLRKLCEMAGYEINRRASPSGQKCASCGKLIVEGRTHTMTEPVRNPDTGLVTNNFYCSIICVQTRNKIKYGREELIK